MSEAPRVLVRCPSCGAPLPPEAARAVVTCAACNATSQPSPVVQTVGTPSCPCCRVPLFPARAGDVLMHGCGKCGGLWLDNEGSEAITRHADLASSDSRTEQTREPSSSRDPPTTSLSCPVRRHHGEGESCPHRPAGHLSRSRHVVRSG
ncbi:MAG: zf-TFIIB domain-containing protein [Myxococcales bacterium]|nr:zf-TFIIB domain-containing protein [Myxococcales bacterium]